jgi:hemoglobin/transferrin/lactoferrin receptor protein
MRQVGAVLIMICFLIGGAAQGFRAPNLSDLTRFDIARSGEQETPSLSLSPEKYLSFETGIKSLQETWQGSLSYFYTFIDGMISRVPTGNTIGGNAEVTRRNVGTGYVHGFEAAGSLYFGRIGLPYARRTSPPAGAGKDRR